MLGRSNKDSFFVYLYKRVWAWTLAFWGKARKSLWVLSTGNYLSYLGFILLILPFSFAYIMELQKETMRIMQGNCYLTQPKTQELSDL